MNIIYIIYKLYILHILFILYILYVLYIFHICICSMVARLCGFKYKIMNTIVVVLHTLFCDIKHSQA